MKHCKQKYFVVISIITFLVLFNNNNINNNKNTEHVWIYKWMLHNSMNEPSRTDLEKSY